MRNPADEEVTGHSSRSHEQLQEPGTAIAPDQYDFSNCGVLQKVCTPHIMRNQAHLCTARTGQRRTAGVCWGSQAFMVWVGALTKLEAARWWPASRSAGEYSE